MAQDNSGAIFSPIAQGAGAGASVGGPYGAVIGGATGVISGLLNSGSGPSIDVAALYNTIQNAGAYQQQIINALPAQIQQNLATYAQTQGAAGQKFAQQMQEQGAKYLQQTQALYGPNSAAGQAQKTANTQAIYSTVPGTQNAVRNALAATGGLQRGNAGVALAQPYITAAAQNSQANANVNAQQTTAGQGATQQALNTVNSMDAATFQQLFGMSQEQAKQILTTGNVTLQNQLTQLLNQSQTQTNQELAVNGIQSNAGYQNDVAKNAANAGIVNGLVNTGAQGIYAAMSQPGSSSSGDQSFNPETMSSPNYANANPSDYGIYNAR